MMNGLILSGLLLASVLVTLTFGDLCTPDQWEGFQAASGGYVRHRSPGSLWEHSHVSYDAKNKRKASMIRYRSNGVLTTYQMVERYDDHTGMRYVVDLKTNFCWRKKLYTPFKKTCIPDDATTHPSYYIGLKNTGLKVSAYMIRKHHMSIFIAVTKYGDAIIPVHETVRGVSKWTSFIQDVHFANITPGIKNGTVFDIPEQCKEDQAHEGSIHEYLEREHFSMAV